MANTNGNAKYSSDVFSMLLQDKNRALEIYNAMNGTTYDDPEEVEITTLEDRSFSLSIRNDASFIRKCAERFFDPTPGGGDSYDDHGLYV